MKTIRIRRGAIAATFSLAELEKTGYRGGCPSQKFLKSLAKEAFSEISEHPKRIKLQAYISENSLLLFAEESPVELRFPC